MSSYGVGAVELTEANIITGSADRTIKVYIMSLCVIILILHHYEMIFDEQCKKLVNRTSSYTYSMYIHWHIDMQ